MAYVKSISIRWKSVHLPVEKRKQSGSLKEEGFAVNANRFFLFVFFKKAGFSRGTNNWPELEHLRRIITAERGWTQS